MLIVRALRLRRMLGRSAFSSASSFLSGGSVQVDHSLSVSAIKEDVKPLCFSFRLLLFPLRRERPDRPLTERMERAHADRARSAIKEDVRPLPPLSSIQTSHTAVQSTA